MVYYCCETHVELAIDTIVDEHETAPILEKTNEDNDLSTTCNYCNEKAIYKISG